MHPDTPACFLWLIPSGEAAIKLPKWETEMQQLWHCNSMWMLLLQLPACVGLLRHRWCQVSLPWGTPQDSQGKEVMVVSSNLQTKQQHRQSERWSQPTSPAHACSSSALGHCHRTVVRHSPHSPCRHPCLPCAWWQKTAQDHPANTLSCCTWMS